MSTSHLLPTNFPWGWKPRYPERIKSILTDPGWHVETSSQLVCTGQPHKADGALPTPVDLCAPSFSHTAFFTLKNSAPDPWSFESNACLRRSGLFSTPCEEFQLDAAGMKQLNQHDLALQAKDWAKGNYLFCLKRMATELGERRRRIHS